MLFLHSTSVAVLYFVLSRASEPSVGKSCNFRPSGNRTVDGTDRVYTMDESSLMQIGIVV